MPFQLNAIPDERNVSEAIELGEGQQIELREQINSALDLSKLVSGFANSEAGWVIIGVREPRTITGVDGSRLEQFLELVNQRIQPVQNLIMRAVTLEGRQVRVVVVAKSPVLVMSDAGAFKREGERTRVMTADEIRAKSIHLAPPALQPENPSVSIARLTTTVDELMAKFDAQSWGGKRKTY